ncbi:MAG TPA: sulfatase-like hydrolase/transferase [Verrucomicrobiaceae bacterium]
MKIKFHFTALVFLFGAALLAAPGAASAKLNVLFIMTDQHVSDAMSCRMGDKYLKTPALDSLAANGMFFTRAFAANPICMPSRNAIFTGRYPHETGVTANIPATLNAKEFVNMGTYFRRAGYETAYAGKWHLCYKEQDVDTHGFESVAGKGKDSEIAEKAVNFIRQKHDRPFLLGASFVNPHNICEVARGEPLSNGPVGDPPPPDQLPPAPANLPAPQNEPDSMTVMRQSYHATDTFPVGNFTPQKWRELRWAYYRLIEKVDAEIGKVLGALRESGLEGNTLVIFTADHGECAGAHGFNQKTVFYEESAGVPLIVSLKDVTPKSSSDKLVNTGIDILPTMLDFAGMEKPAKLPGMSLRAIATGQPLNAWRDYVVVGNNMVQGGAVGLLRPVTEGRMLRTARYKYCVFMFGNQRESLVDLEKDPGEMTDLAADPASHDVLLQMRDQLRQFGAEHQDPLVERLLADDIKARPFTTDGVQIPRGAKKKKASKNP